jgi:hypothetical protein
LKKLRLADTDTLLADDNLGIGDPLQLVANGHHGIEPLDINWQTFPADGKNGSQ